MPVIETIETKELTVQPGTDTTAMTIDQNNDAVGLEIDSEATTASNYGLKITTGQGAYGLAITTESNCQFIVRNEATSSFEFKRNTASATTTSPVLTVKQDHAGDDQAALKIQQDGNSYCIHLDQNGTTGSAIYIDQDSNTDVADTYAITIDSDNAGTKAGGGIDLSSMAAGEPTINFPAGNASSIDPSVTAETGWINIAVGGTVRYIPYYAAA